MYQQIIESFDMGRPQMSRTVDYVIQDEVAVVVISNEPARNALSIHMWGQIESIFLKLAKISQLRAVVLRGAGTDAFAAGADISEFPELRLNALDAQRYNDQISRSLRAVAALEIPTLAMIRGFAVGGGCELSAACDLRIGAEDARIGIPIGKLGVILGVTESKFLVRHLGVNGLKRVLFSGELFEASEALRIGLLDEILSKETLVHRIDELLTSIVSSSAITMSAAKVITDLSATLNDVATERVGQFMNETYDGEDLKEGVSAFLQKRSPSFDRKAKE